MKTDGTKDRVVRRSGGFGKMFAGLLLAGGMIASSAQAEIYTTWNVGGSVDGGNLSGSFIYSETSNSFRNVNIVLSGGSAPQTFNDSFHVYGGVGSNYLSFVGNNGYDLSFGLSMPAAPGAATVSAVNLQLSQTIEFPTFSMQQYMGFGGTISTSGAVDSNAPEPASMLLCGTSLLLGSVLLRRRTATSKTVCR